MKLIENKTTRWIAKQERAPWGGKIEEEYVNKKGKIKTRKIKENYLETNIYFYQKDHLGSIIAITDETGTIVEEYAVNEVRKYPWGVTYDIFGKPYSKDTDWKITRLKKSPVGNKNM